MAEIRVRDLDEWVVEALRVRARRNGRSLVAEVRDLLRQEAARRNAETAGELVQLRDDLRARHVFTKALGAIVDSRAGRP